MRTPCLLPIIATAWLALLAFPAGAGARCEGYGPQAPRDITSHRGLNRQLFDPAPPPGQMNLCNIRVQSNAGNRGPGFNFASGLSSRVGFRCNISVNMTKVEREPARGAFRGVNSGDTVEIQWIYSSCAGATPGPGIEACMPRDCADPRLRIEAQAFLLVNDREALDFAEYSHDGHMVDGRPQPKSLPVVKGDPVVFLGSTAEADYDGQTCSPHKVTWSVRPRCARLDIDTLHAWADDGNVFAATRAHRARELVTDLELLAPIR